MKPILNKLYASYLFKEKKYIDSAQYYGLSNEKFEDVCLKFLNINNNQCLLKYLFIIFNYKFKNSEKENNFIEKYLIHTWLFELTILEKNNNNDYDIINFMESYIQNSEYGKDYIDKNILYFAIKYNFSSNVLKEFLNIYKDYELIITDLINSGKIEGAIGYLKTLSLFETKDYFTILNKIFYKYAKLFMKVNPKQTIDLLDKYFYSDDNIKQIIGILLSFNITTKFLNNENLRPTVKFIKKLIMNFNAKKNREENVLQKLYNLFIYFSSLMIKDDEKLLINFLMDLIMSNPDKIYIDFNIALIFLKNNKFALCLLYYIFKQYNQFVEIALENNLNEILEFLLARSEDEKIKEEISNYIKEYQKVYNDIKKIAFFPELRNKSESNIIVNIDNMVDNLPLIDNKSNINEENNSNSNFEEQFENWEKIGVVHMVLFLK